MKPKRSRNLWLLFGALILLAVILVLKTGLFERHDVKPPRAWVMTTRMALSLSDMAVTLGVDDPEYESLLGKPLASAVPLPAGTSIKGHYVDIRRPDGQADRYYLGEDWHSLYDQQRAQWLKVDLTALKEYLTRQDAIRE